MFKEPGRTTEWTQQLADCREGGWFGRLKSEEAVQDGTRTAALLVEQPFQEGWNNTVFSSH